MRQREKIRGKKKNFTAKRKRLKARIKPHGKKKKTSGKISSIPRGHFNPYFSCREVIVILSAVRLFYLLWGFSFCHEVNSFAVTVVGHRTFEILFPKILDFSTCGYSWELARTFLIKTLDISLYQTTETKLSHSVTDVCPLFAAKRIKGAFVWDIPE